jgi:hypothetical protein
MKSRVSLCLTVLALAGLFVAVASAGTGDGGTDAGNNLFKIVIPGPQAMVQDGQCVRVQDGIPGDYVWAFVYPHGEFDYFSTCYCRAGFWIDADGVGISPPLFCYLDSQTDVDIIVVDYGMLITTQVVNCWWGPN